MFRALLNLSFLFLYIVGIPLAQAELQLAVWQPPGFKYPYLVPVRDGETLEHAVDRYQAALNMNADLMDNLLKHPLHIPHGKITDFAAEKSGPRAVIIANKLEDMRKEQEFINYPGQPLRKRGIKPYVIPIDGELGLSQDEAEEFRKTIKKQFDLAHGIGGDDIVPRLYGERLMYARGDMSLARDKAEMKLKQELMQGNEGPFLFDICRAHQMMGVASGQMAAVSSPCTMVQDIPKELDVHIHPDNIHKITIDREKSRHLAKIFTGTEDVLVKSLHHQSLDIESLPNGGNELIQVVAYDLHGVVEAIELKNGRGLGVQFHPELMGPKTKDPFYDYIAAQAKKVYRRRVGESCEREFSEIGKHER
jgi:putative glutamine amidotransferase